MPPPFRFFNPGLVSDVAMRSRRSGFTLIELLTVLAILGLLAALAANRFWTVKNRAYKVSMRNDLRTLATQQERYFEMNHAYASDPSALADFNPSAGVTILITWSGTVGWAGVAEHASVGADRCGYFTGPAPGGVAAPAAEQGIVVCD